MLGRRAAAAEVQTPTSRSGRGPPGRSPGTDGRGLAETLGLFGMAGSDARSRGGRCTVSGMRLLYASRSPLPAVQEAGARGRRVDLDDLLAAADVVSLHAALTPETHHVLGAAAAREHEVLGDPGQPAAARLVDERALAEALENGQLRGAALDVFEDEPRFIRGCWPSGSASSSPCTWAARPGHPPAHGRPRRSGRAGRPGGRAPAHPVRLTGAVDGRLYRGARMARGCGIRP